MTDFIPFTPEDIARIHGDGTAATEETMTRTLDNIQTFTESDPEACLRMVQAVGESCDGGCTGCACEEMADQRARDGEGQ